MPSAIWFFIEIFWFYTVLFCFLFLSVISCQIRYISIMCTLIEDWRTTYKILIELDYKSKQQWTD